MDIYRLFQAFEKHFNRCGHKFWETCLVRVFQIEIIFERPWSCGRSITKLHNDIFKLEFSAYLNIKHCYSRFCSLFSESLLKTSLTSPFHWAREISVRRPSHAASQDQDLNLLSCLKMSHSLSLTLFLLYLKLSLLLLFFLYKETSLTCKKPPTIMKENILAQLWVVGQ